MRHTDLVQLRGTAFSSHNHFERLLILKNFATGIRSIALTGLFVLSLPMAALAVESGVSDSIGVTTSTGDYASHSDYSDIHKGTESAWTNSSKDVCGKEVAVSNVASTTQNPNSSYTNDVGHYTEHTTAGAYSSGTYDTESHSTSDLTNGTKTSTSITQTASSFAQ